MKPPPESASSLYTHNLETIGLAIASGEIAPGSVQTLDELGATYAISKSVLREAIGVLESMGMVTSRRRVGVQVLDESNWDVYDHQLIHWRLKSDGRLDQIRSLMELRQAIEPEAASLAAERASIAQTGELMSLAARLWAAGRTDDMDAFIDLDTQFHRLLLFSSGNEMFARLSQPIVELIRGRAEYGLMPHTHSDAGLQGHVDVAQAIQASNAEGARDRMLNVIRQAIDELGPSWGATPPVPAPDEPGPPS